MEKTSKIKEKLFEKQRLLVGLCFVLFSFLFVLAPFDNAKAEFLWDFMTVENNLSNLGSRGFDSIPNIEIRLVDENIIYVAYHRVKFEK